jgi:hypothetical protein
MTIQHHVDIRPEGVFLDEAPITGVTFTKARRKDIAIEVTLAEVEVAKSAEYISFVRYNGELTMIPDVLRRLINLAPGIKPEEVFNAKRLPIRRTLADYSDEELVAELHRRKEEDQSLAHIQDPDPIKRLELRCRCIHQSNNL